MWRRITTRSGALAFAATVLVAVVVLISIASGDQRAAVQTTGVLAISPVATIGPNREACQRPMVAPASFGIVSFPVIAAPPRPPLRVLVRDLDSRRLLARGTIAANFDPGAPVTAVLHRSVPADRSISLCVRNAGHTTAAVIYGDNGHTDLCAINPGSLACRFHFAHPISSVTTAYANGATVPGTMSFVLSARRPATVLSQVGAVMRRASTFRPGFVGPWLWWLLLAAALVAVPAALWWALRDLADDAPQAASQRLEPPRLP